MNKTKDEAKASMQEQSCAPRKKRRRKKNYADDMYGARPAPEDARIIDEYARLNGVDRTEVVRLALHKFALLQQMKYQPKDALQELREKVLREHFAQLFEQLETMTQKLQELPQTGIDRHIGHAFSAVGETVEQGAAGSANGGLDTESTQRIEFLLREQKRALEQVLLASTLALRLLATYLVEPQLRHLEPSNPASLEPHLRAAEAGKSGWSAATAEVMRRTGKQVLHELNLSLPETKSGTPCASQNGSHGTAATITDAEIGAAL